MAAESYTTSEVAHITGFSMRQLDYWAQQGILEPGIQQSQGPGTRRRYSFDDIIQLRFIRQIKQRGWSTQKIREALVQLRAVMQNADPLKSAVLIDGKRTILAICKTSDGERILLDTLNAGGQQVIWIVLETLAAETLRDTQPTSEQSSCDATAVER